MMKTILIISNSGEGLLQFRKEVITALCQSYRVVVSIPENKNNGALEELGAKVIDNNMERRSKNLFKDLKLLRHYGRLIEEWKPACVLTYTIKPNIYGGMASQRRSVPYIANITGLGTMIENGGLISRGMLILYKIGLKNASCVFFQNETNYYMFLNRGILSGKARVIPGSGVNLESHPLAEYPAESEPVRFLFVGRIMRDKGIEELLYAVEKVREHGGNLILDIIGSYDEDYRKEIEEAENKGFVHYHGFQNDVNSFIKKAHCVVLPSYHEGMSNVMLEAASSGRPVITTTVPGCRETFDERITGFGCEAKNGDSLVEAMEKMIALPNEKRAEMGLAGHRKIAREFDRNKIVQAYTEEIASIQNNGSTT